MCYIQCLFVCAHVCVHANTHTHTHTPLKEFYVHREKSKVNVNVDSSEVMFGKVGICLFYIS